MLNLFQIGFLISPSLFLFIVFKVNTSTFFLFNSRAIPLSEKITLSQLSFLFGRVFARYFFFSLIATIRFENHTHIDLNWVSFCQSNRWCNCRCTAQATYQNKVWLNIRKRKWNKKRMSKKKRKTKFKQEIAITDNEF